MRCVMILFVFWCTYLCSCHGLVWDGEYDYERIAWMSFLKWQNCFVCQCYVSWLGWWLHKSIDMLKPIDLKIMSEKWQDIGSSSSINTLTKQLQMNWNNFIETGGNYQRSAATK